MSRVISSAEQLWTLAPSLHVVAVGPLVEAQRVVGEVEAERRVDDRHDDAELAAERHAGNEVGAGDGPDVLLESDLRARNAALAGAVVVDRAAIERGDQVKRSLRGSASAGRDSQPTSMPKSSKNEKVTGPAIGMRYSALVVKLVSPPIEAMP